MRVLFDLMKLNVEIIKLFEIMPVANAKVGGNIESQNFTSIKKLQDISGDARHILGRAACF